MAGVVHGADLGMGLFFEVQLHVLYTHMTATWEQDRKMGITASRPRGITHLKGSTSPKQCSGPTVAVCARYGAKKNATFQNCTKAKEV